MESEVRRFTEECQRTEREYMMRRINARTIDDMLRNIQLTKDFVADSQRLVGVANKILADAPENTELKGALEEVLKQYLAQIPRKIIAGEQ